MNDQRAAQGSAEDSRLVAALRKGDEKAFLALVQSLNAPMLRVASVYVSSRGVAEEVVQEAWLSVLEGLPRFEGRSSLRRSPYPRARKPLSPPWPRRRSLPPRARRHNRPPRS